jgi:predicted chitinase
LRFSAEPKRWMNVTAPHCSEAYWKEADRQAFEAKGVRYRVNRRAPGGNKNLSARWRKINRARSRTRSCCEHPFRVVGVA